MNLELGKILMEWAICNQEYYMAYILYTEANIGIPVKFIYHLPSAKKFNSISSFMAGSDNRGGENSDLNELLFLFSRSNYTKLPEWNSMYGYKYKN